MAAEVYKAKRDVAIPRAIRESGELADGTQQYETEGRNYPRGSFVLAKNISPPILERVENGELDYALEEASSEEAEAALSVGDRVEFFNTFIPEHEVEAYYLQQAGHTTVPRDQVLELRSAGEEAVAESMAGLEEGGGNERPNLTAPEAPSLAEVSRGEADNVPVDSEEVEVPPGTQMPPGLPVGDDLAGAAGADVKKEEETKSSGKREKRSSASSSSSSSSSESGGGSSS